MTKVLDAMVKNTNILVVEDTNELRNALESLFKCVGYGVVAATNGLDALEKLKEDSFDLILTDALMPSMDGFELCRQCHLDAQFSQIPLVFYTANYTDKKDEVFALSLGATEYLIKPMASKKLVETINRIINEHKNDLQPLGVGVEDTQLFDDKHKKNLVDKLAEKVKHLELEIAERRLVEEELLTSRDALNVSETKYRLLHDAAFDAIIVTNFNGSIVEGNKSTSEMFGYDDDELCGRSFVELLGETYRETMTANIHQLATTGAIQNKDKAIELQGVRKDGKSFPIELTITCFELRGTPLFTSTIRDITERKASEESIKHMAYHDSLTGLPNRLLFIDRLDQVLQREAWRSGNVAVLFLDLNRFKVINDTLGHSFGDELLKVVARRLEECLREGDTVARQGGDEFTIILQDLATVDDIPFVLEKILDAIKKPVAIDGEELIVGTSIGVSVFPNDGFDSDTLLKNADTAMYRAKAEGKSCFQMYSTAMSSKANNLLKIEHKLSKALDKEEFTVHYQPELDIKTGKLVGMEALVRLVDPEDGKLIPPGEFIPVAEETGIIIPLSEWVLRTACEQDKRWLDAGYPPITVAVNISPKVFRQQNFKQTVADILKETGLKPECLELEVTEETMLLDTDGTVETMTALRELGVRFAIDDFGTGYSSLSYLKKLPIEMLKIDRSFINDIFTDADDKAIVTAIIHMAHSMGIEVLAEGVETEEQLTFLSSLGCDKAQGYLFSKPVPYDEFENLFNESETLQKDGTNYK